MKPKIIYRHPRGRFVVEETTLKNSFGAVVHIRKTRMTPEKDKRGLCSEVSLDVRPMGSCKDSRKRDKPYRITEPEKELVLQMYEEGYSMNEIAQRVERGIHTVRNVLGGVYSIPRYAKTTPVMEREILRLHREEGLSAYYIAMKIHRSRSGVEYILRKNGIAVGKKKAAPNGNSEAANK